MTVSLTERAFAVLALLLFTKPFVDTALVHDRAVLTHGDFGVWALFVVAYATAFVLLGGRQCYESFKQNKVLLCLILLASLSLLWSEDPALTFKRGVALLGTAIVGAYLAGRHSRQQIVQYLACALGIAAALSVVAVLLAPNQTIMNDLHVGAWQGIYAHKNVLGRMVALGAVACFFTAAGSKRYRIIAVISFLCSSFIVVESASMTALLALVASLCLMPGLILMRRHPKLVTSVSLSAILLISTGVWLTDNSHRFFRALGRDETFTGRLDLWESATLAIEKKPWVGHGYGTGWIGEGDDATTDIAMFSDWKAAPNAHNGLLNVTLDLGLVGFVLFIIGYTVAVYRGIICLRSDPSVAGLWPLILLFFIFLTNLTESTFLKYNSLDWLLYITIIFSLSKAKQAGERLQTAISRHE
jgi:O-antigen ligase